MKAPWPLRLCARWVRGLGRAKSIAPAELAEAARREQILILAFGAEVGGLPGEERLATLEDLPAAIAGVGKGALIVTHCA